MTTNLSAQDYRRLHDFRSAIRGFLRFSETAARNEGIETQQHQLLLAIKAKGTGGGLLVGEIADELLVRHNTAVELVDRAEARGFVVRQQDHADRRHVQVRLTPGGEDVLARLSAAHMDELRTAAPQLLGVLSELVRMPPVLPDTETAAVSR